MLDAVGSQFLHGLHQQSAPGQRGTRAENLPTLRAAVLTLAVSLVPVALYTDQAV